jgi:hypothetical protein
MGMMSRNRKATSRAMDFMVYFYPFETLSTSKNLKIILIKPSGYPGWIFFYWAAIKFGAS